jgi:hypothetical protein
MTLEHRVQLLQKAVAGLFEVSANRDPYSRDKRTRFQVAFDGALDRAVEQIVRDMLKEPQFMDALTPLVTKAVQGAVLGENAERLASVLSDAITKGMEKLRGY